MFFGKMQNYTQNQNTLTLYYEHGTVFIQQMNAGVLRFTTNPETKSYAVIQKPADIHHWNIVKKDEILTVSIAGDSKAGTKDITLHIGTDFYMELYEDQIPVCCDYRGGRLEATQLSDEHKNLLNMEGHKADLNTSQINAVEIIKTLGRDDAIYGLGDKPGCLNKRGYSYENWNTDDPSPHVDSFPSLYKSIPFFLVLGDNGCYGLLADNTYRTTFDFGKESKDYYFIRHEQGELDYYYIAGENPGQILSRYVDLTGHATLPQKWLFGYHQSRWSYMSAQEVRDVANKFRSLDIPCDSIHLDIDYMDGYRIFTFDPERFPDPAKLSKELADIGFKLIAILDPGIKKDPDYDVYKEGIDRQAFALAADGTVYENTVWPGTSVFPDFTKEDVRTWWGEHVKILLDAGIRGIWNDMNEPASFSGPLPDDVSFAAGRHDKIHNVYGHLMAEATYDGLRKYDADRRPFVLTRACYAGSQRYCAGWTGDNHSIWAHIPLALEQMCNLGLSGIMMSGSDIGGFGSDATPELMIRFFQATVFSPFFRSHSAMGTRRQEPWVFDEETTRIIRHVIRLRYRFLPYLYDLAHSCAQTGAPILRPLVYEYPDDKRVRNLSDQYLLGSQVLVAPVIEPGKTARAVYLPEGRWYDFFTGKCYEGGGSICVDVPLDYIPIYVKAGALLPLADRVVSCVDELQPQDISIYAYPGSGYHIHYCDDGETYAYKRGACKIVLYQQTSDGIVTKKILHDGYEEEDPPIKILTI